MAQPGVSEVLKKFNHSTADVDSLYELSLQNARGNFGVSTQYARHALQLSERIHYPEGKTLAWVALGAACRHKAMYDSALYFYNQAIDLARKVGYPRSVINSLHGLGLMYYLQGEYQSALQYYLDALDVAEKEQDQSQMGGLYNSIALLYNRQGNYAEALSYYLKSFNIREKLKDRKGISLVMNNLAYTYYQMRDTAKALETHERSLKIKEQLKDEAGIALSYASMGEIYLHKGDYTKAQGLLQPALEMRLRLNDRKGLINVYTNLGLLQQKQRRYHVALPYFFKGQELAGQLNARDDLKKLYKVIAEIYSLQGSHKIANQYYQQHIELSEVLFAETTTRQIAEMQAKYESSKKEEQIRLQAAEIENQHTVRNLLYAGGLMLLCLVMVLFMLYRQKQSAHASIVSRNKALQEQKREISIQNHAILFQKQEIEKQKKEVEKAYSDIQQVNDMLNNKNREITDSIRYARRLQNAILPPLHEIREVFPESFVFFKPRDVVSGDFYYFAKKDKDVIVAAIDCTGHGVPGAFMSIIGYELLNQIITTQKLSDPAEILQLLDREVGNTLRHEEGETADGMDMVLCSIDTEKKLLRFAGAQNALFIVNVQRPELLLEIKGSKRAIGDRYKNHKSFVSHTVELQSGDTIYCFTDGYADQFGGEQNKKYTIRRFRQLISDIYSLPLHEQETALSRELSAWMGNEEQIDDILVMGVRVN